MEPMSEVSKLIKVRELQTQLSNVRQLLSSLDAEASQSVGVLREFGGNEYVDEVGDILRLLNKKTTDLIVSLRELEGKIYGKNPNL